MRYLRLEVGRQVDDANGAEWALLWAYTTADAKTFGNVSDLGFGRDFDAQLAASHNGAGFLAFLPALFRLALVVADNGNSGFR